MHEKCVIVGVDFAVDAGTVIGMDRPSHTMSDWAWSRINPYFNISRPAMKLYRDVLLQKVCRCTLGTILVLNSGNVISEASKYFLRNMLFAWW